MSTFGKNIIVNLFGESHGAGIGITINNLPAGIKINFDHIDKELLKRRPKSKLSTPRQEQDEYKILSGYYNDKTTGTPLTFVIPNKDTRSKDYTPEILRPSHADYTSHIKHDGHQDYRGGGHFSGRITAPLVILGAIATQILNRKNIYIGSHIASIKDVKDVSIEDVVINNKLIKRLLNSDFPTINDEISNLMKDTILAASNNSDSVGGITETVILGIPPGYGDPFFDSVESILSHLLFSVPAVKGVSFGKGFDITQLFGSEANDPIIVDNGLIKTSKNNSGGIQGGISNGMPITFKVAIKPTASIGKAQNTINIKTLENTVLHLKGRHDPCIVHRVIHVINAISAFGILDIITRKEGLSWIV